MEHAADEIERLRAGIVNICINPWSWDRYTELAALVGETPETLQQKYEAKKQGYGHE